jgi:uncharacterized damage-inducible protein DinB
VEPAWVSDERASLEAWLDYHRDTLLFKCQGLDGDQLKRRAVPPSPLSLLGLVRHMAEVERWWFGINAAGSGAGFIYCTDDSPDADFDDVDDADPADDFEQFRSEVAAARATMAGHDLDAEVPYHGRRGGTVGMRWIMVHMIEEYARHNGHADLIREVIDGATGD